MYVRITDGVVVQKQPSPQDGFIEAPEWVTCGCVYTSGVFSLPPPVSPSASKLRQAAFEEKWPDPYDLIDDILLRGLETILAERAAIREEFPDA